MKTLESLHERIKSLETKFQSLLSKAKNNPDAAEKFLELEDVNRDYANGLGDIITEFGPAPLAMEILREMSVESSKSPLEVWAEQEVEENQKIIARTIFELSVIKERLLLFVNEETPR
jgi:hypothetical protein